MGFDPKDWALKWLKGTIISYVRGRITSTMLFGRVRRCLESYNITASEIKALINIIITDPTLNLGSVEERHKKVEPLLKFLDEFSKV